VTNSIATKKSMTTRQPTSEHLRSDTDPAESKPRDNKSQDGNAEDDSASAGKPDFVPGETATHSDVAPLPYDEDAARKRFRQAARILVQGALRLARAGIGPDEAL
jgi:hypothetical protein